MVWRQVWSIIRGAPRRSRLVQARGYPTTLAWARFTAAALGVWMGHCARPTVSSRQGDCSLLTRPWRLGDGEQTDRPHRNGRISRGTWQFPCFEGSMYRLIGIPLAVASSRCALAGVHIPGVPARFPGHKADRYVTTRHLSPCLLVCILGPSRRSKAARRHVVGARGRGAQYIIWTGRGHPKESWAVALCFLELVCLRWTDYISYRGKHRLRLTAIHGALLSNMVHAPPRPRLRRRRSRPARLQAAKLAGEALCTAPRENDLKLPGLPGWRHRDPRTYIIRALLESTRGQLDRSQAAGYDASKPWRQACMQLGTHASK